MSRTNVDYGELIYQLLPPGNWINNTTGSSTNQLLNGLGSQFAKIENFFEDILVEVNPLTTTQLIQERYEEASLPDCTGVVPTTLDAKRQQILLRWQNNNGATKQDIIDLLASLGIPCTVTEYYVDTPLVSCVSTCTASVFEPNKLGHFVINFVDEDTIDFIAGANTAGEPLGDFGDVQYKFQCYINKMKPAHTVVEYNPVVSL